MLRLLRCTVADPTCNKTAAKIWIRHDMGLTLTLGFCLKLGQLTSQLFKSVEKSALQSSSPFFLCWHQVDQNWDLNVYICMDVLLPFYLLTLRWTMQNISGYEPIFAFRVLYLGFDLFSACHLFSFRLEYVPLFSGWFLNFQCSFISSSSFILHDFPEMFQCVPLICLHFPWTPHHVASFCLQCFNMSTQLLFKFPAILHRFPLCCAFLILNKIFQYHPCTDFMLKISKFEGSPSGVAAPPRFTTTIIATATIKTRTRRLSAIDQKPQKKSKKQHKLGRTKKHPQSIMTW